MQIKFVIQKKFLVIALKLRKEFFEVYLVLLKSKNILHLSQKAWIFLLLTDQVLIEILKKHAKYADILFQKATIESLKYMVMNNYLINLEESK